MLTMPGLTWRKNPPSQEQSFKAMKAALASGSNFWNGGELYGSAERNSLHLLNEYFTKYPEEADKVVLSIKGGLTPPSLAPGEYPSMGRHCLSWLPDFQHRRFRGQRQAQH